MIKTPQFTVLFYIGAMILFGLLFGRLVKQLRFPNVTGYLLSGLILGPHVLGFYPLELIDKSTMISEIALGFIAFTIGCEFKRSFLKKVGMTPVVIAIFESMVAVILVDTILIATGHDIAFSLMLGAIAAATAPAATVMIIKQYKAHGPVTDVLMSVVALDDAVALIAFAVSFAIAKGMNGNGNMNIMEAILSPIIEIFLALLIGAVFGVIIWFLMRYFKKQSNRLLISVSAIFISSALSSYFGLSSLLTCMMCGMVLCNISSDSDGVVSVLDTCTPPIYVLFFVVSGAGLNISLIPQIGLVGLIYVFARVAGKLFGAFIGAKIMKADKKVSRYLGPALIPQAGVAIGLTIFAKTAVPQYYEQIRTVILCSTMIYELVGPILSKSALKHAGEIQC